MHNINVYLVTVKAVEQSDTDDSCADAGVVSEGGESQRFHFHIDEILFLNNVKKIKILLFCVITKSSIQAPLTCN
jgi:hypothetical protein